MVQDPHNQGGAYWSFKKNEDLHFNSEQDIYMSSKNHNENGNALKLDLLVILLITCVAS